MGRTAVVLVGILAMVALIVTLDVLFLRGHFWLRLMVNVGIVAAFAAAYFAVRDRL